MKNVFFMLILLSLSIQSLAQGQCDIYLSRSAEWRSPEIIAAVELIAAAEIARVMNQRSYNPLNSFLPADRHSNPLRKIGARNYNGRSASVFNDQDYANARMEALKHFKGRYAYYQPLRSAHIRLYLPALAHFFGPKFLNKLDKLTWDHLAEMKNFITDNIDAIIVNATAFPKMGRLARLAHATKLSATQYIIPGACLAAGCFIGSAAVLAGASELSEATDLLFIDFVSIVGLLGGGALGYVGLASGLLGVGGGALLIPPIYLESKESPGFEYGVYNHELGRPIRDQYRLPQP